MRGKNINKRYVTAQREEGRGTHKSEKERERERHKSEKERERCKSEK